MNPDEIIEIDEEGKVHGTDPNYVKSEGERLRSYVGSAWAEAVDIREHAGRSETGRQAAILAAKLEEVRALLSYWNFSDVRIVPRSGPSIGEAYDAKA